MINLLETYVSGILLADQCVYLVHGDLALDIDLNLILNVLVVDVRPLSDVQLMRVVHDHPCGTVENILIRSPLEPD